MIYCIRIPRLEVKQNSKVRLCIHIVGRRGHQGCKLRNSLCRLIGFEKFICATRVFLRRDAGFLCDAAHLSSRKKSEGKAKRQSTEGWKHGTAANL